jgi:hypothetical protein
MPRISQSIVVGILINGSGGSPAGAAEHVGGSPGLLGAKRAPDTGTWRSMTAVTHAAWSAQASYSKLGWI